MKKTCPTCGSGNLESSSLEESVQVPYGPSIAYDSVEDHCMNCGDRGDFAAENDERIEKAVQESAASSVELILKKLSEEGISSAYFERALRLPVRTVSRWKTGKVSASALALVRLVRTYSWLLEVADSNFDPGFVKEQVIVAAGKLIREQFEEHTSDREAEISRDGDIVTINASYRVNNDFQLPTTQASMKLLAQETPCD